MHHISSPTTDKAIELARAGASALGLTLDEALRRPEPNLLTDMLTAEARKLGVPVPPLREVARALAPVIREELRAAKRHHR